jgi:hypothetical protein
MSTTDLPVDVDVLREEIQKTYTDVSTQPEQDFIFPTGRGWAEDLGYPQPELANVPEASVQSFAGVANPHVLGRLDEGATVLVRSGYAAECDRLGTGGASARSTSSTSSSCNSR